jgi:hypothetical protein
MERYLLQYLQEYNKETNKANLVKLREIVNQDISTIDNQNLTYDDMLTYLYCILNHPEHTITKSQELAEFNRFISNGILHIINNTFSLDVTIANTRVLTQIDK